MDALLDASKRIVLISDQLDLAGLEPPIRLLVERQIVNMNNFFKILNVQKACLGYDGSVRIH